MGPVAVLLALAAGGCGGDVPEAAAPSPAYTGSRACARCHPREDRAWQGSQHDLAMQPATSATVLGAFDGGSLLAGGVTSTFYRKDGGFFVRTEGAGGGLEDFEVTYTFGVYPLQQYLVPFPGGRYQALPLAWDSRPAAAGGQRWFHLYPDETIPPGDPLHWTGPNQNWNHMCAECHSTELRKNYSADEDRFATSWAEIDVACEACHGPGAEHVAWAETGGSGREGRLGLTVRLKEPRAATWIVNQGTGNANRSHPRESDAELETCARCHSRRSPLVEAPVPGTAFLDAYHPAFLDERLYFPDGQILDEVYVYGSFVQSRMHRMGVSCSDCHDPHTARLKQEGNALCSQCHLATKFSSPEHHHHEAGAPGSRCVDCHMPQRAYMVVDPRRDHSFRVPRPDLTLSLGVPNACGRCHRDWPAERLVQALAGWGSPARPRHYGEAIQAGRDGRPGAAAALVALARDLEAPAIARATALSLLGGYPGPAAANALQEALGDPDPLLRRGALDALSMTSAQQRLSLVLPRGADPVRDVRVTAGRLLAAVPPQTLPADAARDRNRAVGEWLHVQGLNADRAEAAGNLGIVAVEQGRNAVAEEAFRLALERDPAFAPAAVNLADLYRQESREEEGEEVLRAALKRDPRSPELQHALGLLLVRGDRLDEGLRALGRAAGLAPEVARYAYAHALALDARGERPVALRVLRESLKRHPWDRELLWALATMSRDAGDTGAARDYAGRLLEADPGAAGARALLEQLDAGESSPR